MHFRGPPEPHLLICPRELASRVNLQLQARCEQASLDPRLTSQSPKQTSPSPKQTSLNPKPFPPFIWISRRIAACCPLDSVCRRHTPGSSLDAPASFTMVVWAQRRRCLSLRFRVWARRCYVDMTYSLNSFIKGGSVGDVIEEY